MSRRGRDSYEANDWVLAREEARQKEKAEKEALMRKIGDYTVEDVLNIHKTMLEQDKLLERLTKAGIIYGRVIDFDGEYPVVGGSGPATRVEKPEFYVGLGDWVIVAEETKQITEVSRRPLIGEVVTISRVLDGQRAEVGSITGSRILRYPPNVVIHPGEEWLAGSEGILIQKIDRPPTQEQNDYAPVYWHEIGGLEQVKQELQEAIALMNGNLWHVSDRYNISQPKGVLLYGPPGNGKTMLGRAVATELAGSAQNFIYVKGPEILSKFVGMSEERIKNLFLRARKGYQETGYPSVIFIDECDAIMNIRGSGRSSDVERTIVPAFLTEMDGLEQSRAFLMLATNRPDTLDPAIVREGRIDRHILVGEPDYDAVKAIFKHHFNTLPCEIFYEELATIATDKMFGHVGLSGAQCVAVIDRIKRLAMRRELNGIAPNCICRMDIEEACDQILEERK